MKGKEKVMEVKMTLSKKDDLRKCNNSKLPKHLKDLTEDDMLVIKSQDELREEGIDETDLVFFLAGRGFITTIHTIDKIETGDDFIAQFQIDERVRQIMADAGYKGDGLVDGEFINVYLKHVKYPCEKKEVKKKVTYSLREKAAPDVNEELFKEMISKVDRDVLRKQFQIPMSVGRKPMIVSDEILDMYLEKWAKAKAAYYLAFGRNLSISKKIEYAMEENEMNCLVNELIRKYPKYALNIVRIPAKNFVENKMPDVPDFKMYFGDDFTKGMKVSKFFSLFGDGSFDDDVSAVMQERTVKGFLTISIDPYDYMTHAISMHGWGSCHSPVSNHRPMSSFMYMIDETNLVAYKHNGKTYMYDKGMYRDVDSPKPFDFKKNSFEGNSKSFRQLILVDQDTTSMIFSREYPKRTTSDDLRTQVRMMFEDVLSKYLGIENEWANYGDNLTKYVSQYTDYYYSDIANYASLRKSYGETVKMDYVSVKDADISKSKIVDGTKTYCLNCGKELKGNGVLCDDCYGR